MLNNLQLAQYMNIDEESAMNYVVRAMKKNTELFDKKGTQNSAREAVERAFFWGLEIHALLKDQAGRLLRSQGDTYKPFISGEVNRSLKNLLDSGKNQADLAFKYIDALIRIMGTQNPGQALPLFGTQSEQKGPAYLDAQQALELIHSQAPNQVWDEDRIKGLLGQESGTQLPEVRASMQDLRAIGIRHDGTQSLSEGTEGPKDPEPNPEERPDHRSHHENRRQKDLRILDDEDVYED